MIFYEDKKFLFWELFNENNGTLVRSDIKGTKEEPFMRSFPELIDVGIMGHCEAGTKGVCKAAGVDCYQKGATIFRKNMTLVDYKKIVKEARGRTFQIAIGGAGDPNKHENFGEILEITRGNGIIPNMTTSGINISEEEIALISKYCGAVAVSYYSRLVFGKETNEQTLNAIIQLRNSIPTNVHYVISKDSIAEATYRIENDIWPAGINAVVFLLYKPVGFGENYRVVENDNNLKHFMETVFSKNHPYRIGFDTCFTPILSGYTDCLEVKSLDACEAARFSIYIDSEMNAYPCSFDNQAGKYKVSLNNSSIQEAWDSSKFESFRRREASCMNCDNYTICKGGCGLELGINAGANCKRFYGNHRG